VLDVAWTLLKSHQLTLDSFVEMIRLNAPEHGGAALFAAAISHSITEEALRLARALTDAGLGQYPVDQRLINYQKALAPPKLISRTPSKRNFAITMRWLSTHSHEYVGQWIAVQDGVLISTGGSRKMLVEQLGDAAQQDNMLITHVPST